MCARARDPRTERSLRSLVSEKVSRTRTRTRRRSEHRRTTAGSETRIAVKRKAERERANAIAELSLSVSRRRRETAAASAPTVCRPPIPPRAARFMSGRISHLLSLPALSLLSLSLPLPLSLRTCVFQFVCARMCAFLLSVRARVSERGVDGARIAR